MVLDGDWLNPTNTSATGSSVFPSGDGVPTGDFEFVFVSLRGDFNGDNVVDVSDLNLISANFGLTTGATFADGDINGDGAVDLSDFDPFGFSYGKDLRALTILADLNGDLVFDQDDEAEFLALYDAGDANADVNQDGVVDLLDLDLFFNVLGSLDLRDSIV